MAHSGGSLDANVILRLLLDDIPEQHKAVVDLFKNADSQFTIADTAIIEVVFVLCRAYDFSRIQAAEAIEGLMQLTDISCNRILFENSLPLFLEHPSLSFEDCCLAAYAKLTSAEPLWTFDKKLANQVSSAELVTV